MLKGLLIGILLSVATLEHTRILISLAHWLDRVVGRDIQNSMPAVPALRRLQNEMQMLLYTHPVNDDGTWGYEEDTVLQIRGQSEPFHHTDRNLLTRVAAPTPNPLARK